MVMIFCRTLYRLQWEGSECQDVLTPQGRLNSATICWPWGPYPPPADISRDRENVGFGAGLWFVVSGVPSIDIGIPCTFPHVILMKTLSGENLVYIMQKGRVRPELNNLLNVKQSGTFYSMRWSCLLGDTHKSNGRFLFNHVTIILSYMSCVQWFVEYHHLWKGVCIFLNDAKSIRKFWKQ